MEGSQVDSQRQEPQEDDDKDIKFESDKKEAEKIMVEAEKVQEGEEQVKVSMEDVKKLPFNAIKQIKNPDARIKK